MSKVKYPSGARVRFTQPLGYMSNEELWDLIGVFSIPTDDREEWGHAELRQRIVDFVYAEHLPHGANANTEATTGRGG